jgi:hypothetical protein
MRLSLGNPKIYAQHLTYINALQSRDIERPFLMILKPFVNLSLPALLT